MEKGYTPEHPVNTEEQGVAVSEGLFDRSVESSTTGYRVVRTKLGRLVLVTAEAGAVHKTVAVGMGPIGRGVRVGARSRIDSAIFGYVDISEDVVIGPHGRIGLPLAPASTSVQGKPSHKGDISRSDTFLPTISIGSATKIGKSVNIHPIKKGEIRLGKDVQIGDKVTLGPQQERDKNYKSIIIGSGTHIAAGTVIQHDVTIGNNVHIESGYILQGVAIPDNTRIRTHGQKRHVFITKDWLEKNPHLVDPPMPPKKPAVS